MSDDWQCRLSCISVYWRIYSQPSFSGIQKLLSRARGGRTTFSLSPFFWTLVIRSTSEKSRATTSSCVIACVRKHQQVRIIMRQSFPKRQSNMHSHPALTLLSFLPRIFKFSSSSSLRMTSGPTPLMGHVKSNWQISRTYCKGGKNDNQCTIT